MVSVGTRSVANPLIGSSDHVPIGEIELETLDENNPVYEHNQISAIKSDVTSDTHSVPPHIKPSDTVTAHDDFEDHIPIGETNDSCCNTSEIIVSQIVVMRDVNVYSSLILCYKN